MALMRVGALLNSSLALAVPFESRAAFRYWLFRTRADDGYLGVPRRRRMGSLGWI